VEPDVQRAVALARELLHRSGALRVSAMVDRGQEREPAVVACARLGAIEVTEDGETRALPHDAPVAVSIPELPHLRQLPAIEVDPVEGTVAAPLGGVEMLGRALRAGAEALGGRSVVAADYETTRPDAPLGLAAQPTGALVVLLGEEEFALDLEGPAAAGR
jgi:hypothetical protein